jgi:O-antigen ligase
MSSSYRADYWQVAARDAADHPLLGSGAGSFAHVWLQRRPVAISAHDAHSLYLETLAELGPLGLLLVLALAATPTIVAVRNRKQPLVAVAGGGYAAFLVHAGIDWDWEMPVVVLSGLACAVAILASARVAPSLQILTNRARL